MLTILAKLTFTSIKLPLHKIKIPGHAEGDVDREGEAQGHSDVEAGV
jgi:hypothetical protein